MSGSKLFTICLSLGILLLTACDHIAEGDELIHVKQEPAQRVVLLEDTADLYNPKVVQATMGAIFRVPFHRMDIAELCRKVVTGGGHVYGTFLNGENIYSKALDCGLEAPSVIVIGNESNGISPAVAACVSDRLFIPPYPADDPGSESLNAAIATAITVAEFRRR